MLTTAPRQAELALERPGGVLRRRVDAVGVVLGLTLTPLLVPAGPGNTGFADVGVASGIVGWLLVSRAAGRQLRIPYALSVTVLVCGGALAILSRGDAGAVLVLVQDVVLLLWAAAVAALVQRPSGLSLVVRAWVTAGVASATVTLIGYVTGVALLAGTSAADGSRASATLGDPNLAASWFVLSLLVLRAGRFPRRNGLRWLCATVLVLALLITGSNGGVLALLAATALGWLLGLGRRRGPHTAVAVAALVLLVAVSVHVQVPVQQLVARVGASVSVLDDSVGRTARSEEGRSTLFHEAVGLARTDGLTGVGPGGTREALRAAQAPYVKEAHDDYLAVVVERGVLGGLGLVLLIATVCARLRVLALPERRAAVRSVLPRPELLGCALLAVALSAALYEVLHFRHVWALLGLVAGLTSRRSPTGTA